MPAASGHSFRPKQATREARGYDYAHRKARAISATVHDPEDSCARCGSALGPMGPHLHYDHDGSRTGYLGFSHARCNVTAGAREGARRRQEPSPRPRRDWYE